MTAALHETTSLSELGEATPTGTRRAGLRRFLGDRAAVVATAILVALALASILAPWLVRQGPINQSDVLLAGPGRGHLLGTDELGRDLASRLLYGARISLVVAFGSAALGALLGVPVGLVAGYLGRWTDILSMRVMDLLLAIPHLLLALVVVTVLGSSNVTLLLAIGIVAVPTFARLSRASVLTIRERDFVLASRATGASKADTMLRTILPNILGPVVVQFIVTASAAVVVAAGLSFLGLGPPPPAPSWGGMLQTAKSYLYQDPWYGLFPGLALTLMVACLDRIGHGLQRAFGTSKDIVIRSGEAT